MPEESASPSDPESTRESVERQHYEKPTFLREQVFETMALACGKTSQTTGRCRTVKKNS